MAGTRRLLAIAMTLFTASGSGNGNPEALGIVAQADRARLGSGEAAAEGTTIYDGDRLATDTGGSLHVFIGEAALRLTEQSSAIVHGSEKGAAKEFEAELLVGSVVLSVAPRVTGEIVASAARIRPAPEKRGIVQVRVAGPRELVVSARRGAAEISYRDESEIIPEGKSYRVLLNPAEDGASGEQGAKPTRKRNKALLLVAIGAGTAAGIAMLWKGMEGGSHGGAQQGVESPDRP